MKQADFIGSEYDMMHQTKLPMVHGDAPNNGLLQKPLPPQPMTWLDKQEQHVVTFL